MEKLSTHLKIEKINNKAVIYQLYVDLYNYLDRKIFICNAIEENLYTNIRIVECGKEIYKSKCVAELRTKLTLEEIEEHIVNPNLEKSNLSAIITLENPQNLYPTREQNSKIEHLSEKYLSDVINFLERKPTEKEVNYLTKKENKNIKNLEKLLNLPRWKMHLALDCSSMFVDPSELKDFVYTSKGKIKELGYRPTYISDKYIQILHNTYGQLANDYDSHLDKKNVLQGRKEITEETKLYILKNLEKKSVKEFCEIAKKKYANIETGYLQNNLCVPLVIKKEFEFMCSEEKLRKLSY